MSDNMKVLGKGLLSGQDAVLQQSKLRSAKDQQAGQISKDSAGAGADRVDLRLGQAINQLFDAEKLEEDRRERIAALKELVEKNQYKPPVDKVAQAVAEEIGFEIAWHSGNDQVEE